MKPTWIISDHHIALETEKEILHPDAKEIYALISAQNDMQETDNPVEVFSQFHFSKIGSLLKCEVNTTDTDEIQLLLYADRKGKRYPVDMIQGHIIDQCISEKEWFYLNGYVDEIQTVLSEAGIEQCGKITLGQYISIVRQECLGDQKVIINRVSPDMVSKKLTERNAVPAGIKADLYDYQKTGYSWISNMIDATHGCILGDEMGLGKTLQIITVFESLKQKGKRHFLVVAPVSLLENWKQECNRFAPDLRIHIHHGSNRTGRFSELLKYDVVVISYNTAVSDFSMLKMITWACVVLDEAQNIKNPYSKRAKSVKALNRKAGIAVTGTPFENHITDIWSLADFAVPSLLGKLADFKKNVSDDVLGAQKIEPLLTPVMIRRSVKDVADDLPEKIVISQPIEMSAEEKAEYEQLKTDARNMVENGSPITIALLQKMRMFCTHRELCCDEAEQDPFATSIKYQRFCELVEEIIGNDEKMIVFTSYKKMFEIFRNDIPKRFQIEVESINGETPVSDRQGIVDWFNTYPEPAMLVLNPRAAGTGLNITGANHVIHFNLEWNPAQEDQSSARAYRRGQKKNVFIYRLFYIDSVEQIVNERIERKREIASNAVVGTDGVSDRADILRALELSPDFTVKGNENDYGK